MVRASALVYVFVLFDFFERFQTCSDTIKLWSGAGERNRTLDLLITSELLYQLSYTGKPC